MIEIISLKKKIGSREILKGLNLSVKKGEIVTIVGPSGSGKSTLLRCINRLTEFDSGDILINGVSVREYNPLELRRIVGIVFQLPVMFDGSVEDNIAYGLRLSNVGKEVEKEKMIEMEKEIKKIAREVGIEDFLSNEATKLSIGEQQRVALARALILKPKVMLLDEPTSALDPKNEENIENLILKLVKSKGITVLWVTHDVAQARRVGDRVSVMKEGRIILTDIPEKIAWEEVYV
ncbi:MAG: phosphate ABC transporter ATP-binding protein [Archaeoglobus sp.]|nr:phosphate ABC transporter ATP-binding protein [Archaeoglobus sp.]